MAEAVLQPLMGFIMMLVMLIMLVRMLPSLFKAVIERITAVGVTTEPQTTPTTPEVPGMTTAPQSTPSTQEEVVKPTEPVVTGYRIINGVMCKEKEYWRGKYYECPPTITKFEPTTSTSGVPYAYEVEGYCPDGQKQIIHIEGVIPIRTDMLYCLCLDVDGGIDCRLQCCK